MSSAAHAFSTCAWRRGGCGEIADLPERIDPPLAALGGMIGEGLVTVSNVHVLRFLPAPKG
jgi:hypothetical protein